jgi:hypothetical protein
VYSHSRLLVAPVRAVRAVIDPGSRAHEIPCLVRCQSLSLSYSEAVNVKILVSWVVIPYSLVRDYQRRIEAYYIRLVICFVTNIKLGFEALTSGI